MRSLEGNVLTRDEIHWFHEGTYFQSYRKMGAHMDTEDGIGGVRFTVWAPNAREVRLASDRNGWNGAAAPLTRVPDSGLWTLFVPGMGEGELYKYEIVTSAGDKYLKADPYAFHAEVKPQTASIVASLGGYRWQDRSWMKKRQALYEKPMLIYEVHLASWKKHKDGSYLSYEELADELVDYVAELGYTHIELLPVAEHPYDKSWGYQATGYYAVTSRHGKPQDFMRFVDRCHGKGIGVILDWVPGHFVRDAHGLRQFDGTAQFEHPDPLIADRPGWGTLAFDYGKPEVRSFLISNALFWMDVYHIDGLRIDAVTSMIRHDFDKPEGAWRPNVYGGFENLEGIALLRKVNAAVFAAHPSALMMAEESSAWPLVTAPIEQGGLGFNYKWNMGWMNDTLTYFETDPVHRKHHHNLLTFPICYAYAENFALPLSHDEVVHGKRSLLNKMPGDMPMKFAGLRSLLAYWISSPGKKLLYMGSEFGQFDEWKDETELDWFLLEEYDTHADMLAYTKRLNRLYAEQKALWQLDHRAEGFEWIDCEDKDQNVISYIRRGKAKGESVIVVCNFSPVRRERYRIGVPARGTYEVLLNTDDAAFGGAGTEDGAAYASEREAWHGRLYSILLTLPPMSVLWLKKKSAVVSRKAGQQHNI